MRLILPPYSKWRAISAAGSLSALSLSSSASCALASRRSRACFLLQALGLDALVLFASARGSRRPWRGRCPRACAACGVRRWRLRRLAPGAGLPCAGLPVRGLALRRPAALRLRAAAGCAPAAWARGFALGLRRGLKPRPSSWSRRESLIGLQVVRSRVRACRIASGMQSRRTSVMRRRRFARRDRRRSRRASA